MSLRIGLVGARGYVGSELIKLLSAHPVFELSFVASRERDGQLVGPHEGLDLGELRYNNPTPAQAAALGVDAMVLALPNGMAGGFADELDLIGSQAVLLDLSADFRFDDKWYYGLPELTRAQAEGKRRISNPGCYATAMQLALAPIKDFVSAPAQCFGVSGYSGAGTKPSDKNDPELLRDNLMPYSLIGHIHEREVTRQLGQAVEFMPAVAPHFRGITMTVNAHLQRPFEMAEVRELFRTFYKHEPLVAVQEEAPWVSRIAGEQGVRIGGFTLSADGRRLVLVSVLDNLLKGAATQALQNLNLAFGLPELQGIPAFSKD